MTFNELRSFIQLNSRLWKGTLKMRDMKLRDMKMRHHVAGVLFLVDSCIPARQWTDICNTRCSILSRFSQFHVSHFPPLQHGAAFSSLAFSTPAFLTVPYFHVSHFQSPPIERCLCLFFVSVSTLSSGRYYNPRDSRRATGTFITTELCNNNIGLYTRMPPLVD